MKLFEGANDKSADESFINAVSPRIAVANVRAYDPFGSLDENVVLLLENSNIDFYRTDENYTITIYTDGNSLEVRTMNEN